MSFRKFYLLPLLLLMLPLITCLSASPCLGQSGKEGKPIETMSESTFEDEFPTPLLRAIVLENAERVQELLRSGAAPNVKDHSKYTHTPILLAAQVGELKILKMLLAAGANINARNEIGITALMITTLKGNTEVVRFLIAEKADVNAKVDSGGTALMSAALEGRVEIIKMLLKAGADVDAATNVGATALMAAADDPEVVRILVEAGANVDARDKQGRAIVCWAKEGKQLKKLEALIKAGAKPDVDCKGNN